MLGCAELFPSGRAITATDVGLLSALDPAAVEKADELGCIVVTNNTRDYREEARRYAEAGGKRTCTDLFGLPIIPNDPTTNGTFSPSAPSKSACASTESGLRGATSSSATSASRSSPRDACLPKRFRDVRSASHVIRAQQ